MVFPGVTPLVWAAERPSAAFDDANKLYEQGKYTNAITAYTKLLDEKEISPAIYFNIANAYFKAGHPGHAIVYYRLAQRLAPRDPDIRANLRFARESIGSSGSQGIGWRLVNMLTLNELTLATVVVVWVWLLVLAVGQLRRDWASALRLYRWLLGAATVLTLSWLGLAVRTHLDSDAAVVVTREATIRYGPFEEAQRFYTARDGTELAVLDRKDNWLQVVDPNKRVGWVPNKDVVLLPRG
jgi:tetratricopeptide (TPR) repeat protein